jgi:parvulin-like peptidyl-prolyl isomerase
MKTIKILTLTTFLMASTAGAVDLAKVNGKVITDRDVNAALGGFNEGQKKQLLSDTSSKREIVSNLVEQELLIQEGEKQKLDQDAEYKEAQAAFRRQYLTQRVLAKNVNAKMNESGAKKFYESNKRKYSTDKVHVQHILVADEKTATDVLKQAKAPKADFQKLAEKLSKDPSAKNNRGDIGVITRDSPFVEEFKTAAFEGDKGEVLGPIKTLYGYHVIKVVDKQIGKTLGYNEVEMRVKADFKKSLVQNYIVQLRKQAQVSLDDKALNKL